MNKMAEKISGAMTQADTANLITDHYLGEAQMLTSCAEENLLKLKDLICSQYKKEAERWQQIKTEFQRRQAMGGQDVGPMAQIANSVSGVVRRLEGIEKQLVAQADRGDELAKPLARVARSLAGLRTNVSKMGVIQNELVAAPDVTKSFDAAPEQMAALAKSVSEARTQVEVVNQPVPGIDVILQMTFLRVGRRKLGFHWPPKMKHLSCMIFTVHSCIACGLPKYAFSETPSPGVHESSKRHYEALVFIANVVHSSPRTFCHSSQSAYGASGACFRWSC